MEKILYREGFTAEELPNEVIERIKGISYKENPHVKLGDLAYLRVRYYDFEHKVQSGELIVARKLAQEVLDIFYELFEGGYEIEKSGSWTSMTLMMKGQWRITIPLPSTTGWWLVPTLSRLTATAGR